MGRTSGGSGGGGGIGAGSAAEIAALTAVATPAGTDEFPVNQGGTSKKETLAQIKTFVQTDLLAPGQTSGGQAAAQVQIGSGALANGNNGVLGAGSVAVGYSAEAGDASAFGSTALGANATATADRATAVGRGASAGGTCVALGDGADTSAGTQGSVAIGYSAVAAGVGALAIGQSSSAASNDSIAIGGYSATTAANQLVIGGVNSTWAITDVYIGDLVTNASPLGFTLNATGGSGSDVAGASATIAGGKGTGNAAGGAVIFKTSDAGGSGSTLQSLTEKCRVPVEGGFQWTGNGSKPSAGSAYRGMVWYTPGGAGVLDTFEICRKDAADAYAWVSLF